MEGLIDEAVRIDVWGKACWSWTHSALVFLKGGELLFGSGNMLLGAGGEETDGDTTRLSGAVKGTCCFLELAVGCSLG